MMTLCPGHHGEQQGSSTYTFSSPEVDLTVRRKEEIEKEASHEENKQEEHACCFLRRLFHLQSWKRPIHKLITEMKRQHGAPWLQFSMSFHRFPNLRGDVFQSHLALKMIKKNTESINFLTHCCSPSVLA
jgi:hypothetical protein